MRILDVDRDIAVNKAILYLTDEEALQLTGYLEQLLKDSESQHFHLDDENFERELIVTIYRPHQLMSYDDRSRRLIESGE
jgi:hypothetical protein